MLFFLLIVVVLFLAHRMTTAEDREKHLQTAIATAHQLKAIAMRKRPEIERFNELLRGRAAWPVATMALVALTLAEYLLGASGTGDNAEALVRWGASYGPRTTNGEWWRLLSSLFVHPRFLHVLVNALAIAQTGWILERLAGRPAFALSFFAAGAVAGLVSLSQQAVAVTLGASGAVFGLYGLMAAAIALTGRTAADEFHIAFPVAAIRRLAPLALVFFLFNMVSAAVPFMAELAGFGVGAAIGFAVLRGVGEMAPPAPRLAAAGAAAVAIVATLAWPLRGMADVRPEIARVIATEEATVAKYLNAADALAKGKITPDAVALVIDKTITPELEAEDARLKALKKVPREHAPLVADAEEYLKLRSESWRLRAESLRKAHVIPARKNISADTAGDATWRLRAEAQFRNNRVTAGKAEGMERSSLEVLARLRNYAAKPSA